MRNVPFSEAAKPDEKPGRLLDANEVADSPDSVVARGMASASESKSVPDRRFLWIYTAIVGSILLRLSVLDFESGDYKAFLGTWYDYFVQHGRWTALKDNFTGYPVLYLYVVSLSTLLPLPKLYAIKLFSIVCDYLAVWYAFKIVRYKFQHGPFPWVASVMMLFLPTVWL